MSEDILATFWSNVEWIAENKHIPIDQLMDGNSRGVKSKRRNITLKKVEIIAYKLDIDDITILFEKFDNSGGI